MKILIIVCIWAFVEILAHFKDLQHAMQGANTSPKIFVELSEEGNKEVDQTVMNELTIKQTQPILERHEVYLESELEEDDEAAFEAMFSHTQPITETQELDVVIDSEETVIENGQYHQNEAIWHVEVIGAEKGYIHVLHEGSRKLLYVGDHQFAKYSLLKVHLDFSQGVEDVLNVEVLYVPEENVPNADYDDSNYAIVL